MSFFRNLFGNSISARDEYIAAMAEMASEADRTYRGMIDVYNADVKLGMLQGPPDVAVVPSGRGLYKARLFGAVFMVIAYMKAARSPADAEEMMNLATGVALDALQGQAEPNLDREEAKLFTMPYLTAVFKSMLAAFEAGPLLPGSVAPEHVALADHMHSTLAESIGVEHYTAQVRERFTLPIQGNVATAMNHARRWMVE